MKSIHALLCLFGVLFSITQAQFTEFASQLPQCGLQCIVTAIRQSTCDVTNSTCICTNPELLAISTACISTSCDVTDALMVERINEKACQKKVENYQGLLKRVAATFCILAEVFVVLRIYVKLVIARTITPDDWVIIGAALVNIPYLVLAITMYNMGFGANIWDIPPENLNTIFKYYLIDEILYLAILALTKISILCFLQRIFPRRQFQIAVWTVVSITAAFGVVSVLITVFQCSPVPYAWTKWSGTTKGKCNNINAQTYASAGVHIVLDFAILLLPVPELYMLNVSTRKRLQLFLMFSVGLFVSITSIIRLRSLVTFAETVNPTIDYTGATLWSAIESEVAIICSCLPSVRHLLGHLFPKIFQSTAKDSTPASNSGIWQSRSFKLDKTPRADLHNFHELDERTNVAGSDSSLSEHRTSNASRHHPGTPDSQRNIVDGNSNKEAIAHVWALNEAHRSPQILSERPVHQENKDPFKSEV